MELLIVIVVIAILAAITIVAYNGIQSRARFAQAVSDLKATQKVIELYKAENGSYPVTSGWSGQGNNSTDPARNSYIPGVVPSVTNSLPIVTDSSGQYYYNGTAADYKLIKYRAPLADSEWALVPADMKDQLAANKDRYGVWSSGGANY